MIQDSVKGAVAQGARTTEGLHQGTRRVQVNDLWDLVLLQGGIPGSACSGVRCGRGWARAGPDGGRRCRRRWWPSGKTGGECRQVARRCTGGGGRQRGVPGGQGRLAQQQQ